MVPDKEVIAIAKYISNIRQEFELAELKQYISEDMQAEEIFRILKPHLFDLSLTCNKKYACEKIITRPLPYISPGKLDRLSPDIETFIENYIEERCGKDWFSGETAIAIRDNIVRQKDEYWKGKAGYPEMRVISYLLYHFPVYFCQFQHILMEMLESGVLSNRMCILDAGAGPGTVTLSIMDFIRKLREKERNLKISIKIQAIEQSPDNVRCYDALTGKFLSGISGMNDTNIFIEKPIQSPLESVEAGAFDLIVLSNVLAEMPYPPEKRAGIVAGLGRKSGEQSTIVIIEPADLENSVNLRKTQRALIETGYNVFSPCTPIWGVNCREKSCWSFDHFGNIEVPGFMKKIASEESYRYINTDMKCSYVILRKDGKTRHSYRVSKRDKFIRLSRLAKHVGNRVNIVASLLSKNLGDEENHVYKICDGTPTEACYAVLPRYHISTNNQAIVKARYGDVLEIYSTLVRYNPRYKGYNMLISRDTRIEIAG